MNRKAYPIERVSVDDLPSLPDAPCAGTPSQPSKVFLVGVLGPFDSGPTRVYETLLRSRFVDYFQVRFLDVRFAANIGDFEKVRAAKFLRLVGYLWSMASGLLRERHSALCIPLATNRNAFLKDSLFAWIGFYFRVPVIILEHGTNIPALYERSGRMVRWFMRATLKRTARCVVLAECLKFNFESFLPADRVVSTYLGIDQLTAEERRRLPGQTDENRLTVLYLSTLVRAKGILVMLEAFSKVVKARKGIRLVVAGGWGRDASEIKARAEEWLSKDELKNAVSFIGPVQGSEKVRVLSQADIFVLPTLVDTAPLVILEAMRAGLPIISTDVGAIPEIVLDGQNGLICPSGNADELAGKILYLAERSALRQQMSRHNLKRFEDLFTTESFASRMIGVFESVFAEANKEPKRVDVMEPSTN
jgi:glycosyltransferase involved in cell wall biosynthesis